MFSALTWSSFSSMPLAVRRGLPVSRRCRSRCRSWPWRGGIGATGAGAGGGGGFGEGGGGDGGGVGGVLEAEFVVAEEEEVAVVEFVGFGGAFVVDPEAVGGVVVLDLPAGGAEVEAGEGGVVSGDVGAGEEDVGGGELAEGDGGDAAEDEGVTDAVADWGPFSTTRRASKSPAPAPSGRDSGQVRWRWLWQAAQMHGGGGGGFGDGDGLAAGAEGFDHGDAPFRVRRTGETCDHCFSNPETAGNGILRRVVSASIGQQEIVLWGWPS